MDVSIPRTNPASLVPAPTTSEDTNALLGMYEEICKSHQAIDEFRMKLLGLLPLASLAGIFLLSKSNIPSNTSEAASRLALNELVAFISIFAALFTLALFMYEIRGILRCDDLIKRGSEIEKKLRVFGQFSVCQYEYDSAGKNRRHRFFNAIVAACFIYSLVFAAWVFLALHDGFGLENLHCMITAPASGIMLGYLVYRIVRKRIPA